MKLTPVTLLGLALLSSFGFSAQGDGKKPTADPSTFPPLSKGALDGDFIVGPPYSLAPELTTRADVPKGQRIEFVMDSTESRFYPGIAKGVLGQTVPYKRRVHVYIPAQYQQGTKAPFFVSQDSLGWGVAPTMLDNMIADRRLPAMIGIMIDSGGSDAQGSERGLEYDTLSGAYAEFIEAEVLPRIERDYHVEFTKDPDGRMAMGGSSGAACAFSMAWYHPDLYHRVLSYSGTYVNQQWPPNPATLHGAWEYHEHLVPQTRRKPIRIWMHVGDNDLRPNDPEATLHNWVLANNRMAAALKAKGYHYQYVFAKESGHVDGRVVNQTLPAAFEYVWRGYRASGR